ncbi:MAG: glycosyltransferase family 39 protein [Vulcanimicrobiota bacterium]
MTDRRLLLGLLVLAAGLRLYGLGAPSFWTDEGVTFYQAHKSLSDLLATFQTDVHPPLYYVVCHFWGKLFGLNEFGLRLLSALATWLTIPVTYYFLKQAKEEKLALVASALMTCSLFQCNLGMEARNHAPTALLLAVAVVLQWKWLEEGASHGWLVAWMGVSLISLYANFFSFVMLPVASLVVLARPQHRPRWALWFSAQAAVVTTVLPLLLFMRPHLKKQAAYQGYVISHPPGFTDLMQLLHELTIYHTYPNRQLALLTTGPITFIVGLLSLALLMLGLYSLWQRRPDLAIWLGLWVIGPFAETIVLPLTIGVDVFVWKYFIAVLPAFLALLAEALCWLYERSQPVAIGLGVLLIGTNLVGWGFRKFHPLVRENQDWRRVGGLLARFAGPDDAILVQPGMGGFALTYYYRGQTPILTADYPSDLEAIEAKLARAQAVWLISIPSYEVVANQPVAPVLASRRPLVREIHSNSFYEANLLDIYLYGPRKE